MTDSDKKALLMPGERERPTLKTIARLAGVAVPTVSRALSNAPGIGESTKERVRALALELGYRPNRAGLRLRTGKTNVLALVLSTDHDVMNHTAKLITAVASECRGTPYHLVVMPYFPDESPLTPVEYIVRTGSADGVILNRIQPRDTRVEFLRERRFPFVMHGRTADCGEDPYFDFDNETYGRLCAETFAARGRKRMLIVAPPGDQSYSQHMTRGASEAATSAGMTARVLEGATSDSPTDRVAAAVAADLALHPDTDCVMTASAPSAVAATQSIEAAGRTIGRDIDLASKEAISFLKVFRQEILVFHEDVAGTGSFLARALMQRIDRPDLPALQKVIRPDPLEETMTFGG